MSYSDILAEWATSLRFEDLPEQVISNTRLRVLDVIGLALAGRETAFGKSVVASTCDLTGSGSCGIIGGTETVNVTGAAFANGALSQALEFDDTHNRSIVHMSSPAVSAALALAQRDQLNGKDVITAIALGNEISCRIGSVAPQQFHRRGFHPTGLFATFGVTVLASWLLNANARQTANAQGIAGSFASGLLQCWVDGTQSKFLHPGWAAQAGIQAATLGKNGTTGPGEVYEGRFGLLASHLQNDNLALDWAMLTDNLGTHWESENASFKPFPVAHVIHPYIDALLRVKKALGISADDIESIHCPVPEYQVGIVCEPLHEKRRPNSDSHGRVSLQFTLAEAMVSGKIDKFSYSPEALTNQQILALADRIEFQVDETFPGPEQFKGEVSLVLKDGRTVTETEEFNRGSAKNPMPVADIIGKFTTNASGVISGEQQQAVIAMALDLDNQEHAGDIISLTSPTS
jgi:2-methylcitrate dehydratase PrpD